MTPLRPSPSVSRVPQQDTKNFTTLYKLLYFEGAEKVFSAPIKVFSEIAQLSKGHAPKAQSSVLQSAQSRAHRCQEARISLHGPTSYKTTKKMLATCARVFPFLEYTKHNFTFKAKSFSTQSCMSPRSCQAGLPGPFQTPQLIHAQRRPPVPWHHLPQDHKFYPFKRDHRKSEAATEPLSPT